MLVVEVADTTYQFDRTVKLRKYASASIRLEAGQTLQSHQLPSVKIDVTGILESSEG
jgi:hypothetical protein